MAEASVGKRIKISKIQQHMMLAVLVTSLVFGVSLVLSIYFVKYIAFNTKVIDEKDSAISDYYTAIKNVGICIDKNKDGKYSEKELNECKPDEIQVDEIPNTLRYNVLVGMAENNDLESVARDDVTDMETCYDKVTMKKKDFSKLYQEAQTDEERDQFFYNFKLCSSLRVVPDALPASENKEALLSSMNQIFLLSGVELDALSPSTSSAASPVAGLQTMPVAVSVKDDAQKTTVLLRNFERSVRSFYFTNAVIAWRGGVNGATNIELSAQALAFYTNEVEASEKTRTIYASPEAKKAINGTAGK